MIYSIMIEVVPCRSMIRLYTSISLWISDASVYGCMLMKVWVIDLPMYEMNHVIYQKNSSGFLTKILLSCCLIGILRKSISDMSDAILTIIRMRSVLLRKIFPERQTIPKRVHKIMDSLIHRLGFSKLCEAYRR